MWKKLGLQLLCFFVLVAMIALVAQVAMAMTILSFTAHAQTTQVILRWTTASEINHAGFNMLRSGSVAGHFVQINSNLMPTNCPGQPSGCSYTFTDSDVISGQTYFYKLESVDTSGKREYFGPVSATVRFNFVYFYRLLWIAKDAPQVCSPYPPLDWDPRLGPGGLPYLDQVKIISATVASDQKYWRITKVKFENIDESGNDHSIYVKVTDENCRRVNGEKLVLSSVGGLWEYPEEKPVDDWCNCNFAYPMYGDGYAVHIEDQYPSDKIVGMIMPMRRHVNYRITFQLTTKP